MILKYHFEFSIARALSLEILFSGMSKSALYAHCAQYMPTDS